MEAFALGNVNNGCNHRCRSGPNNQARQKRSRRRILSVARWRFEPKQTTPEGQPPIFKRKIRIVLRNDTGKEIQVDKPDWATDAGDLAIQPSGHGPSAGIKDST